MKQPTKPINVISLFDGISCGRVALERAGIEVANYYASEIDKYALQIAKKNYPDSIYVGDVKTLSGYQLYNNFYGKTDLLIAGSPCQGFSFAGKREGMITECNIEITSLEQYLKLKEEGFQFKGQSYLFWEFVRVREEINECRIAEGKEEITFLLENVRMSKANQEIISKTLGVEPVMINSNLLSAQNRKRFYWTNISNITQPEDRGIMLRDIVHEGLDRGLSENELRYMLDGNEKWQQAGKCRLDRYLMYENRKSFTITANIRRGVPYNCFFQCSNEYVILDRKMDTFNTNPSGKGQNGNVCSINSDKSPTLTTNKGEGQKISVCLNEYIVPFDKTLKILDKEIQKGKVGYFRKDSQANRVYYINDKAITLCGEAGGGAAKMGQYLFGGVKKNSKGEENALLDSISPNQKFFFLTEEGTIVEGYIRKLTPIECERLQTLPDNYTEGVSNSQRYRALGNGWTADIIAHIFKNLN